MMTLKRHQKLMTLAIMFGLFSPLCQQAEAIELFGYRLAPVPAEKASSKPADRQSEPPKKLEVVKGDEPEVQNSTVAQKDGMSLAELNNVIDGFKVIQSGKDILISGLIPKRCAEDAMVAYDFSKGQHVLTVRMPNCENGFKKDPKEEMVDAADVLPIASLKDQSGKIVLRHLKGKTSRRDPDRDVIESLTDASGKELGFVGSEEIAAKKKKEDDKKAAEAKADDLKKFLAQAEKTCSSGDIDALSNQLREATALLGDVSDLIVKANGLKRDKLTKALDSADSAEKAAEILAAFQSGAAEGGWDSEELNAAYITKRFELANGIVDAYKSGEKKASEADRDLKAWATEFRGLDSREFKKRKAEFGTMYADLATAAANSSKTDEAMRFYNKAKSYVDQAGRNKIDGQITKLYVEQFKECVKKDPTKMAQCEKDILGKAKEAADRITKAYANDKGSSAAADQAAWAQEYAGVFGAGQVTTYSDFGNLSQLPGALEQYKAEAMKNYMTEQAQKQQQAALAQQQQMLRQMGVNVPGAAAPIGIPAAGATASTGLGLIK